MQLQVSVQLKEVIRKFGHGEGRRRRRWSGGQLGWLFFQVSVQAKEVSIDSKVQEEEVVHLIARLLIAANPGKQ